MASSAVAENALLVINFAYPDVPSNEDVRARALKVSETLLGLGFQVTRQENKGRSVLLDDLSRLSAEDGAMVVYYVGRSIAEADQTVLVGTAPDDVITLDEVLTTIDPALRDVTALFLDVCSVATRTAPADDIMPTEEDVADIPAVIAPLPQQNNLFIASSVPAGVDCADETASLSDILIERLQVPAIDISQMFDGSDVAVQSTVTTPFVFRPAESGMRLTAANYKMFDGLPPEQQAQMLELWASAGIAVDRAGALSPRTARAPTVSRETVVLTEPVRPVSGGVTLVPVRPNVTTVRSGVRLTAPTTPAPATTPTPASTSRPVPGAGGLPQPSIIVGFPEDEVEASFPIVQEPTGPVAGAAFDYSDLESRRALRDQDPELFATLVSDGALDPPQAELIVALQTELARMNCYTSTIDGQWGPGSRASVGRYYEQIGGAAPSQDPDVRIFRQIAVRDDVTCPAVQRQQPRPATTTTTRQPAAQPAAPAAPSNTPPPRVINRDRGVSVGTGVGR